MAESEQLNDRIVSADSGFFRGVREEDQLAAHYPVLRYTLAVFSRAPPSRALRQPSNPCISPFLSN